MLHEIENIKWDIIGLAETKMKESKIECLGESGHQIFFSGNEVSRSHGVGFLVNKSLVPFIDDYEPISDRLAILKIQGKFSKIIIIQVYFPTTSHPDTEVLGIYDQIQQIIDKIPKRDHIFVMGDFNCKVGGLNTTYPKAIGKHTPGASNARDRLLANFCVRNALIATNTIFKIRKHFTWISPDGRTKNQIDFILTRHNTPRQTIVDCSVLNYPDISDHRLVRVNIKLKFSWPQKQKSQRKYDLDSLKNADIKQSFQLELSNRFAALSSISDSETLYDQITSSINDSVENHLPPKQNDHTQWMTPETLKAIENKHEIRKTHGTSSPLYSIAKAESKKLVKKDKLKQIEDDLDSLSKLPPNKQYYAAIKKLKSKPKNISWGIHDKNNKIITNKTDILERWAEFYEDLYLDASDPTSIDDSEEDQIPPILRSEIVHCISLLKSGKSAGLDNIYSEYLKAGGESLIDALDLLFNKIRTTNKVPQKFNEALIVVLFKKGIRLDCKNYCPISLLSHVYKLFISIIANRVKNSLYESFPESQAAYQPGRGTIEQIIALEQMLEKSIEFNNPLYLVFIDFTKAFDSIKLPCLWKLLEQTSINKRYINLLKCTYDNSKAYNIKTDLGITRPVNILKGVKQGDVLSAILFCIVIASIIRKTDAVCNSGYSIGGHLLSNLGYADDIAAVNSSSQEMQKYVNILAENAEEVGLYINISKTKCMTTNKSNDPFNIKIYGSPVQQVTEFIYLGHKLSSNNNDLTAVQHRIGLGWAAFEKNKSILTSPRVPYRIKAKTYNTYILPALLYGLDCVNWKVTTLNKIETFQNHIMRFMTNKRLTDHISISTLLKTTSLTPIGPLVKSKTLKLYGHNKRSKKGYSKLCLEGMIPDTRSRGSQPKRWKDNIYKWTNLGINALNSGTQNRELWRELSHVRAHSASSGDSDT